MSEIRATTISDATGTGPITLTKQSAAKAWVNFNATGTIAIRDSLNVSGITDDGTGLFTVSFTNAMSSADFATTTSCGPHSNGAETLGYYVTLVGSVSLVCTDQTAGTSDLSFNSAATHGDLA